MYQFLTFATVLPGAEFNDASLEVLRFAQALMISVLLPTI